MSRKCFDEKCDGRLVINDVDDCSITVYCMVCSDERRIEPDGLDEGGMEWVEAMKMRTEGEI